MFSKSDWRVIGEYAFDHEGGRHQAFYAPKINIEYKNILLKAEERIQVERSLKYSPEEASQLWKASGLKEIGKFAASSDAYSKYHTPGTLCLFLLLHFTQSEWIT